MGCQHSDTHRAGTEAVPWGQGSLRASLSVTAVAWPACFAKTSLVSLWVGNSFPDRMWEWGGGNTSSGSGFRLCVRRAGTFPQSWLENTPFVISEEMRLLGQIHPLRERSLTALSHARGGSGSRLSLLSGLRGACLGYSEQEPT